MSQLQAESSSELSFRQIMFAAVDGPSYGPFDAIFALWECKRGTRRMPHRDDITPRDMVPYLSSLQLLQAIDGGKNFCYRVVGSAFLRSLGYDVTGQYVSELADPILRERTLAALRRVVETREPLRTTGDFMVRARIQYGKIEKIFLPLGNGEQVTHILCQTDRVDRQP
jgi:hypothetical protein